MKFSIVIPCYNEAENIPILLERFASVIEGEEIEVVLVNNGSTDQTKQVLKECLPKYYFARSILVEKIRAMVMEFYRDCKLAKENISDGHMQIYRQILLMY